MKKLICEVIITKDAMVANEAWLRAVGGYPLARIAERFKLSYGDVLLYADWVKHSGDLHGALFEMEAVARVHGSLQPYDYATLYALVAMQEANFRTPGWSQ